MPANENTTTNAEQTAQIEATDAVVNAQVSNPTKTETTKKESPKATASEKKSLWDKMKGSSLFSGCCNHGAKKGDEGVKTAKTASPETKKILENVGANLAGNKKTTVNADGKGEDTTKAVGKENNADGQAKPVVGS